MDKKIYSLSGVAKAIENIISKYASKQIWVKAEIVKLNYYKQSGHCYPDLVEKRDGKIVAEIRGNIWNRNYIRINNTFKSVLNEELKDNMTVVCLASVQFHPVYGISLNITDIDPNYTLGELARQKAETITRLEKEQIFDLNKQRRLPLIPKTIAIISVETSKGYHDFMDVIKSNPWGYQFHFKLFPAILQGTQAVTTLTRELRKIEQHTDVFDAVAIIRGGGGDIGLSSFDEYLLAKAVAEFPLPVLSGIGHATNRTITEMVSYKDFITPTKIAEFLIQEFHNFSVTIESNTEFIKKHVQEKLWQETIQLKETARLFSSISQLYLKEQHFTLSSVGNKLTNSARELLLEEKIKIKDILHSFKNQSNHRKIKEQTQLIQMQYLLILHTGQFLENQKSILQNIDSSIKILSPEHILKRGFSITRHKGKLLKDSKKTKVGDEIETQVSNGVIHSKINKIK